MNNKSNNKNKSNQDPYKIKEKLIFIIRYLAPVEDKTLENKKLKKKEIRKESKKLMMLTLSKIMLMKRESLTIREIKSSHKTSQEGNIHKIILMVQEDKSLINSNLKISKDSVMNKSKEFMNNKQNKYKKCKTK